LYIYARGSEPKLWVLAVITLSALLLASRFSLESDRGFALSILVTVMVAYHLFPHDLVLLLIPLTILIEQVEPARWSTALFAGLWLAPLLVVVFYPPAIPLLAVEMLGLLAWTLRLETRTRHPVIAGSSVMS